MKKLMLMFALVMGIQTIHAQTWDEWWRQKKTQIKYLVKQIAALKVYTGYLEKGYQIAKDGTNIIGLIKKGDFNLHNGYFTSLKLVNPTIRSYPKVARIVSLQLDISKQFKRLLKYCHESDQFSTSELHHIESVNQNMNDECEKALDELLMVITSANTEMKDDERLARIERIYRDMQDKHLFTRSFCNEATLMALNRITELIEINRSKAIIGLQ